MDAPYDSDADPGLQDVPEDTVEALVEDLEQVLRDAAGADEGDTFETLARAAVEAGWRPTSDPDYCGSCGAHADSEHRPGCEDLELPEPDVHDHYAPEGEGQGWSRPVVLDLIQRAAARGNRTTDTEGSP